MEARFMPVAVSHPVYKSHLQIIDIHYDVFL